MTDTKADQNPALTVADETGAAGEPVTVPSQVKLQAPSPAPCKILPSETNDNTEAYELHVVTNKAKSSIAILTSTFKADAQRRKEVRRERAAFGAIMFSMFMDGWNDGTSGPMIPAMQKYYNVSDYIKNEDLRVTSFSGRIHGRLTDFCS